MLCKHKLKLSHTHTHSHSSLPLHLHILASFRLSISHKLAEPIWKKVSVQHTCVHKSVLVCVCMKSNIYFSLPISVIPVGVCPAVHFPSISERFYRCEITHRDLSAAAICQGPEKLVNLSVMVSPSSPICRPLESFKTLEGTLIKPTDRVRMQEKQTCD